MSIVATNIIVPVKVQAWIQNDNTVPGTIVLDPPDYFSLVAPSRDIDRPFSGGTRPTDFGIYVHWSLPRGFRKGGSNFLNPELNPNTVPNLWLVTRVTAEGTNTSTVSWIVQSDAIVAPEDVTANAGVARYWDKQRNAPAAIGKTDLLSPAYTRATQTVQLSILDSADQLFADYQPRCQNVFSIYDQFAKDTQSCTVSYSVIGWYDTNDPIDPDSPDPNKDGFGILGGLGLKVGGSNLRTSGSRIIMCGTIYDIPWTPSMTPKSVASAAYSGAGIPQMQCAVGTDSLDAFSALIDYGGINPALADRGMRTLDIPKRHLDCFLQGHYSKLTDPLRIEETTEDLYRAGFAPSRGGIIWEIISRTTETNTVTPTSSQVAGISQP